MPVSMDWARTGTLVVAEVMNNKAFRRRYGSGGENRRFSVFFRAFYLTEFLKGAIISRVYNITKV